MTTNRALPFLVALLVVALFIAPAAWDAGYVLDDHAAVLGNPLAHWPPDPAALMTTPWFGPAAAWRGQGVSRPLVTLGYAVEDGLGLGARGRHLASLTLLAIAAGLLGALVAHLGRAWRAASDASSDAADDAVVTTAAVLTAALFAAHPIHIEATMAVSNRPELVAAVLALVCILAFARGAVVVAIVTFAAALLAKESALATLAPLLLLVMWRKSGDARRSAASAWLMMVALTVGWLAWRHAALPIGAVSPIDNPLVAVSTAERLAASMVLVAHAAGRLLLPLNLAPDYGLDVLPLIAPPLGWVALGGAVSLSALATTAIALRHVHRRGGPQGARAAATVALSLVSAAAFYGPVAQIAMAATLTTADRVLLLPSMGLCVLGGVAAAMLWHRSKHRLWRNVARSAICALIVVFGLGSASLADDWADDLRLHTRGARLAPGSLKMNYNHGRLLLEAGDDDAARTALIKAWSLAKGDRPTGVLLVQAHTRLGECTAGEAVFAVLYRPATPPQATFDAGVAKAGIDLRVACRDFSAAFALGRTLVAPEEAWQIKVYVAGVAAGETDAAAHWAASFGVDAAFEPRWVAAAVWAERKAGRPAQALARLQALAARRPNLAGVATQIAAICDHPRDAAVMAGCAQSWRRPHTDATEPASGRDPGREKDRYGDP